MIRDKGMRRSRKAHSHRVPESLQPCFSISRFFGFSVFRFFGFSVFRFFGFSVFRFFGFSVFRFFGFSVLYGFESRNQKPIRSSKSKSNATQNYSRTIIIIYVTRALKLDILSPTTTVGTILSIVLCHFCLCNRDRTTRSQLDRLRQLPDLN